MITRGAENSWATMLAVFLALAAAYLGMLAVGLPAIWLLRRAKALTVMSVTLTGALGGVVVFYASLAVLGNL